MPLSIRVSAGGSSLRIWRLMDGRGDVVAYGEPYGTMEDVHAAILRVIGAPSNGCHFETSQDAAGDWHWVLLPPRGPDLIASAGPFHERQEADRTIAMVSTVGPDTPIIDEAAGGARRRDVTPRRSSRAKEG